MSALFSALLSFLVPVVVFFVSVVAIVALASGIVEDPVGAVNAFICMVIDMIASFFPSTPENLKISRLVTAAGDRMPLVGRAVVYEVFGTIVSIAAIALVFKIYKLIPFKST
jgi:hypothetical protein